MRISNIGSTEFLSKKMLILLGLGFSSGLPLALTGGTLQAWMKDEGVDLKTIGLFSLVGLPYTLKFLWAPLLDVYTVPLFGRRRGWIFLTQILLAILVCALGVFGLSKDAYIVAIMALMIAFFSASQDIIVDAYRTEILTPNERGAGSAVSNLGYRLAMIVSGAIALILADHLPWTAVFIIMAGILAICSTLNFYAEEPVSVFERPVSLNQAIVVPIKDFFSKIEAIEILVFILIYKIDIVMAVALTTPFMMDIGFSKTEIGAVTKGIGMIASIFGSLVGGILYSKLGLKRCLIVFGIIQGFSTLTFSLLALVGNNTLVMAFAVGFENFCAGLATTPFIAFLMTCCNPAYAATSFALFSSFASVSRVFAGAPTGFFVEQLGWVKFFIFCALTAIPGVLLVILRFDIWQKSATFNRI